MSEKRVALVGCVKQKRPGRHPARDLYTSTLFARRRAYVESRQMEWFILSALYGLVEPDTMIDSYEQPMSALRAAERSLWCDRVVEALRERFLLDSVTFEMHAGADYVDRTGLASRLEALGARVERPLHGLPFGKQLQWYNEQLAPHTSIGSEGSAAHSESEAS